MTDRPVIINVSLHFVKHLPPSPSDHTCGCLVARARNEMTGKAFYVTGLDGFGHGVHQPVNEWAAIEFIEFGFEALTPRFDNL
jgi:hypothetical protein